MHAHLVFACISLACPVAHALTCKICSVVIRRCHVFFCDVTKCGGMNSSPPQDTITDTHMLQRFVSTTEESFIFLVFAIWGGKGVESRCEKSGRFWLPLPQTQETDGLGRCLLNIWSAHTGYQARTSAALASSFCLPFSCECLLHI